MGGPPSAFPADMSLKDAVRQYIDAFNKGDVEVMAETFAGPGINP